jgi:hypothetical protein
MISQLLQPPCHVLVGLVLGDVVDEQRTDSAAVVGGGDGAVALLAGGVPDLCFDGLAVYLDTTCCEFYADGRFAVQVEFVAREAGEEVGFADARVAYQDYLEEELYSILVCGGGAVCGILVHRIRRWPSLRLNSGR